MAKINVHIESSMKITSDNVEVELTQEQQDFIQQQYKALVDDLEQFVEDLLSAKDPHHAYEDAMSIV